MRLMKPPLFNRRHGRRAKPFLGLLLGTLLPAVSAFGAPPSDPSAAPLPVPVAQANAAQPTPASELLRVDSEFDALGAKAGLAEAFAQNVASHGLLAAAGGLGPEDAKTVFSKLALDPKYRLRWTPIAAEAAKSGELGYTVGSFVREFSDKDGKPKKTFGLYLTVWRRDENDRWRFVADAGSGPLDEKTVARVVASFREHPPLPLCPPSAPQEVESARKEGPGLDERFSRYSELNGEQAALRHFISDDALLFPWGVRTRSALVAALVRDGARPLARWEALHCEVSASGELAFSWGLWRRLFPGSEPIRTGTYVAVWQRQKTGDWKLAMKAESRLDEAACAALRQRVSALVKESVPPSPAASRDSTSSSEGGFTQPGAVVQTSAATEQAKRSDSRSDQPRNIP